ncbi:FIG00921294: hypothetical protein [uncultured Candidatus Thioglobus sp.]|nr:FIG00921294: hypothetical protein [uncultured Candidatus Thioglobus sp.]
MKITINYDSSWRNSFLDGNNNQPVPKKGRKYIASITNLKNEKNFIPISVTKDTVMGILNRLIGDQRKLYQSRQSDDYYFADIEDKISCDDKTQLTQEMTYLRNISGSTDQNSFTGSIRSNDVMFNSDYSKEFWGVLALNIDELIDFVVNNNLTTKEISLDPVSVIGKLELLNKEKALIKNENLKKVLAVFIEKFGDINYLNKKEEIVVISLYASALYLQLDRLSKRYDMDTAKTKIGGISGISKRGFTKKDFMDKFTTGEKKKVFGNPYIHETFVKGEGKTKNLMTKASGTLDIMLDISEEKAKEIRTMIYSAGVSSFYLGKKGLAFVDGDISIKEIVK